MSLASVLILTVYLIFNLWLKKLFMGDSGSLPLAWIIAVMALFAILTETLSYAHVAIIHSAFIVDATLTLLYRLKNGDNVTQAHATHLYQRWVKSGRSHFDVSGFYALITALCCLLVWLTLDNINLMVEFVALAVVYMILISVFMKSLNIGR
jgi:UDP-N-acetylmuramyl pentapeptide phosphotransferase/UDP-N-acetylglucosamine-1-phosphate transferase